MMSHLCTKLVQEVEQNVGTGPSGGKESVLAQLLQSSPQTPSYSPKAPGLSLKATQLPQASREGAQQAEAGSDSMQVLSVMNLAAVLYIEFGNFRKSFLAVVSDLGCLFLPKKRVKEIQIFLHLSRNRIHTKFWREDPNRKSHDHVLFLIPETLPEKLIVQKPGRGQDVFRSILKDEGFFLNTGLLNQVMALYARTNDKKHLVTDVQVFRKMSIFSKKKFKDLETIQGLIERQRCQIIEAGKGEISKLQSSVSVQRNVQVSCAKCDKMFRSICNLLLHTKTKKCGSTGNLTETIQAFKACLSSDSNDDVASCEICHKKFRSKGYLQLHKEVHIEIGHIFPCSKCGKIYLSSWYYLQHKCFLFFHPKRLYCNKIQPIPVDNIYGKIACTIVATALTCPICERKFEYISQVFSHLHLGSACLASLLDRVRLDHELSFDFQALVQEKTQFQLSLVVCEVCEETCVGEVAYIMHMDHHSLRTLLECEGCHRASGETFYSLCSFYSHSCHDPNSRYCIFCDQLAQVESVKYKLDTETMAKSVAEMLTKFAEYTPPYDDVKDILEDDDLGLNSINLSFMDYFEKWPETVDVIELN